MRRRERDVRRIARQFGRDVITTGKGHLRLIDPNGLLTPIITPSTPSDWRSERKLRADLRRAHCH